MGKGPLILSRITEVLQVVTCLVSLTACAIAFWRYNYSTNLVLGGIDLGKQTNGTNPDASVPTPQLPSALENSNVGWGFVMLAIGCVLWTIFIFVSFIRAKVMQCSDTPHREPMVDMYSTFVYRAFMFMFLALLVVALAGDLGIGACICSLLTTVLLFVLHCIFKKVGDEMYYSNFQDEDGSAGSVMYSKSNSGPPPPSDRAPVPPPPSSLSSSYTPSPRPPSVSYGNGPPPPPSSSYGGPPPPPPGGGPPPFGGGPPSFRPGPPPAPPGGFGGGPPPPPPSFGSPPSEPGRGALLDSISGFKGGLKKAVTNDRSAPIF